MQRTLLFIFLTLLITISCSKDGDQSSIIEGYDLSLANVTEDDFVTVPVLATTFDANILFVDFTNEQRDKMDKAIEIIKLVVATEEFKNKVLNHSYNGQKTFVDNGGYTNAQIYQIILNGAEKLSPSKNNTMDADVELYYAANNVVGYTYATSTRIWVNTKYFNTYTAVGVAHNLFHEWMHKLGFGHASSWSSSRDYSVPYALGGLIGEIGRDFL
jgi:hypothetical protein